TCSGEMPAAVVTVPSLCGEGVTGDESSLLVWVIGMLENEFAVPLVVVSLEPVVPVSGVTCSGEIPGAVVTVPSLFGEVVTDDERT
ncbi:unnamed protein product, partial [Rotaria socialis]